MDVTTVTELAGLWEGPRASPQNLGPAQQFPCLLPASLSPAILVPFPLAEGGGSVPTRETADPYPDPGEARGGIPASAMALLHSCSPSLCVGGGGFLWSLKIGRKSRFPLFCC